MSLRVCSKLIPETLNLLKRNNAIIVPPKLLLFDKNYVVPISINYKSFNRFFSASANSKEAEKHIKQIYYGVLTPQIRAVKMFSLSSSLVGIVAQPFLYKEIASTGSIPVIIAAYSFIGFFTVVTPVLLHLITKKYITHLEYKPVTDSYVAKTVNFFCMTRETEFKPEEVVVPEVPGMFTTFLAKGKALFLDPRLFEYPDHYARIMGYNKPIDFKLNEKPPPPPPNIDK